MAEIIDTKVLDESWARFLKVRVRLEGGEVIDRQVESHPDVAAVLPYDPARRCALLVRQFRVPVLYAGGPQALTEVPAGLVDAGETPEAAARREAMEETGVRLTTLEAVGSYWSTPGISTERMWLFLGAYAPADRLGPGGGLREEHEAVEVAEVACSDLATACDEDRLDDLKTLALVQALRLRRPELFAPAGAQSGHAAAGGAPP